jgi:leucyl-tRNA synthetase
MVLLDGDKMSKSKGNVVSPQRIVDEYGADTARFFMMSAAQPEKDFDWTEEGVRSAHNFLQSLHELAERYAAGDVDTADGRIEVDDGLDVELTTYVAEYVAREVDATAATATEEFDAFRFNHALQAVRELVSLLRQYEGHATVETATFERGLTVAAKLVAPVAPHVAEEIWELLDGDGLLAEAAWPEAERPAGYDIERRLIENTREDVRDIVDVAGIDDPELIRIAVAPAWKHRVLDLAREADGDVVGTVMGDEDLRERGEAAADFAKDLAGAGHVDEQLDPAGEREALERARWLIEREFDADVEVVADEADADLAADARPGRPAIHIE